MTTGSVPDAPPRGTRPRNRRDLIIAAAVDLFHRYGYEQVSMGEVAKAVNVSPSALYRHFAGKPELLIAAVVSEMTPFRQIFASVLSASPRIGPDELAGQVAGVASEVSRLGTLWRQEARSLPADSYAVLRSEIRSTLDQFTALIRAQRPELSEPDALLLAESTCSALCATSHRSRDLSRSEFEHVLRDIAGAILNAEPVAAGAPTTRRAAYLPVTRRERLLAAAAALFAERGYLSVSMEEIGSRAGITGPTVYYHFGSKQELLAATMERGAEWLWRDLYRALDGTDESVRGAELLETYVAFIARNSEYAAILGTETRHLDGSSRDRLQQSHRDFVGEWIELICVQNPAVGAAEVKIRLEAVLTFASDISRTQYLSHRPGVFETIEQIGRSVLFPERPVVTNG
ncbi:TetR/AcrR family transcriptional regulator [Nocardia speluncae]|uniref:TetR/AcrR family transcriptional regulator n=1 Tax=Nocardia speluncae TaxID=419477 RepID=A0A846XIY4_9NOCA|nr:TetR/AcrR family transcriptional regulator [Nocardia speluncae]NKY34596.1 TetR/AcrR family transcriptional regulator [Nocardia speluncae]